jgi:hypothetical protein
MVRMCYLLNYNEEEAVSKITARNISACKSLVYVETPGSEIFPITHPIHAHKNAEYLYQTKQYYKLLILTFA